MKNKVDLKICGVCGDKALGFNFNAVTCESCKAFFRRNALIQKEFRCPFSNDCKITTVTRRFCQKCRLNKCFSIGMCKDLIMSDEDKAQKRQKIEENRARKRTLESPSTSRKKIKKEVLEGDSQDEVYSNYSYNTDSDQDTTHSEGYQPNNRNIIGVINYQNNPMTTKQSAEESSVTSTNDRLVSSSDESLSFQNIISQHLYGAGYNGQQFEHGLISNFINNNTNVNFHENISRNDGVNTRQLAEDVTEDVVRDVQRLNSHIQPTQSNPIDAILSEAIKLEYETYTNIAQNPSRSRELNEAERAKLNELILANKALLTPVDEELSLIGNEFKDVTDQLPGCQQRHTDPALLDVINLTAIGIRRLIKMAKKINAFKNMCQEDQVALLKGGCTEIMMIISARRYDPTKNIWKIPSIQESVNVNVNVLKLAKGNAYQELERFIRTFDPKWRTDENIILILCAIVLFTPDRPRVIHQDVIKLEQNSYYYLLRRYLESIYAGCEAKSIFLKLIQKIMELHKVNEELINVLLAVNPSQVEPLLIEIFDLK
ncbi:nuclear hormone receptor HR96 [Anthonomus grandis grandis]|uniref:nuclear hormone receptor HR96 n=1 Tax=Anthonomus grandis grandis TaxID=2921223 RepID=UPI0021657940|nr:nuclear hormone receptor HR96 [Anthonomus grandis grandis]